MSGQRKRALTIAALGGLVLLTLTGCTPDASTANPLSAPDAMPQWKDEPYGRIFHVEGERHPYAVEWTSPTDTIRLVGRTNPDILSAGVILIRSGEDLSIRNGGYEITSTTSTEGLKPPVSSRIPIIIRDASPSTLSARVNPTRIHPPLAKWFRDVIRDDALIQIVDDIEFRLGQRGTLTSRWVLTPQEGITLAETSSTSRRMIITTGKTEIEFDHSRMVKHQLTEAEAGGWEYQVQADESEPNLKSIIRIRHIR